MGRLLIIQVWALMILGKYKKVEYYTRMKTQTLIILKFVFMAGDSLNSLRELDKFTGVIPLPINSCFTI